MIRAALLALMLASSGCHSAGATSVYERSSASDANPLPFDRPIGAAQESPTKDIAKRCKLTPLGPEAMLISPNGGGGAFLTAFRRIDHRILVGFIIPLYLPRDWRARLTEEEVMGLPIWKIDGIGSATFGLTSEPVQFCTYAAMYSKTNETISRQLTEAEFDELANSGAVFRSATILVQGQSFAFPAEASISPELAQGFAQRLRELGWR